MDNDFNVIFRTFDSITIEYDSSSAYEYDKERTIFVNGDEYIKTKKNVVSIYGLDPDTEYRICSTVSGEKRTETTTKTRFRLCVLDVKAFGAKGDGIADDTAAIQCAIMACPKDGLVLIPEGTYNIYPLFLKSDINIELQKGATLKAYTDREHFPILPGKIDAENRHGEVFLGTWEGDPLDMFAGIITGIGVSNVRIYGEGVIDGSANAENWWFKPKEKRIAWRPRMIFLHSCEHVRIEGITVTNSPSWNVHPYFSKNLKFINMKITGPKDSPNTDGLDPESCENVEIIGVYFSVGDDCIAVKSGKIYMGSTYKTPSENICIRQCLMRDGHGSITIGSEMAGGIKELKVSSCRFINTDRGLRIKTRRGRGKDAIVDGIVFENIIMDEVKAPVTFNMFYFCDWDGHTEYVQSKEAYPVDERTPFLGKFSFNNIKATNCHAAVAYMYGLPEMKIDEVEFIDSSFSFSENPVAFKPVMMDGVEEEKQIGIFAKNIGTLRLVNTKITGYEGQEIVSEGVDKIQVM